MMNARRSDQHKPSREQSEHNATKAAAQALGIRLAYAPFASLAELEGALERVRTSDAEAMLVYPDGSMVHRAMTAEFAKMHRLPSMFGWREVTRGRWPRATAQQRDLCPKLAVYADRLLRGDLRGLARRAADDVRARHQPENREDPWPGRSGLPPRPRRRTDRVALAISNAQSCGPSLPASRCSFGSHAPHEPTPLTRIKARRRRADDKCAMITFTYRCPATGLSGRRARAGARGGAGHAGSRPTSRKAARPAAACISSIRRPAASCRKRQRRCLCARSKRSRRPEYLLPHRCNFLFRCPMTGLTCKGT